MFSLSELTVLKLSISRTIMGVITDFELKEIRIEKLEQELEKKEVGVRFCFH